MTCFFLVDDLVDFDFFGFDLADELLADFDFFGLVDTEAFARFDLLDVDLEDFVGLIDGIACRAVANVRLICCAIGVNKYVNRLTNISSSFCHC